MAHQEWHDFRRPFLCSTQLSGHDLFRAREAEVRAELEALSGKKHVGVLPGEHLSFHHVLSASQMKHLQIARSLYAEGAGARLRLDERDIRGVLADCDHNPMKRGRFSKIGKMMSQLQHACIWSEAAERPLVRSLCKAFPRLSRMMITLALFLGIPQTSAAVGYGS